MPAQGQKSWDHHLWGLPPSGSDGHNACPVAEILGLVIRAATADAIDVAMPAQGQKSWNRISFSALARASNVVAMPAQGQKSWDTERSEGRKLYIVVSQCLPRGRNPGTPSSVFCMVPIPIRNACPGAEILGLDEIHGLLVFGARRNACPGAEILGPRQSSADRLQAALRNACPGAEILGRRNPSHRRNACLGAEILGRRFVGAQLRRCCAGRNACPGAEILGRESQCLPRGRNPGTSR